MEAEDAKEQMRDLVPREEWLGLKTELEGSRGEALASKMEKEDAERELSSLREKLAASPSKHELKAVKVSSLSLRAVLNSQSESETLSASRQTLPEREAGACERFVDVLCRLAKLHVTMLCRTKETSWRSGSGRQMSSCAPCGANCSKLAWQTTRLWTGCCRSSRHLPASTRTS